MSSTQNISLHRTSKVISLRHMIKHVIFDCDGVLLDTEIVAAEVMSAWLRDQNVSITAEQFIQQHTGKTFSGIIHELKSAKVLSQSLATAEAVNSIERQVKADLRLIQGIGPALEQIKLPKSVVSNSSVNYVRSSLGKFGLSQHFENRIYSSQMVEKPKPSPLIYQLALKRLELTRNEILVVEDSVTGVSAARDAGLRVVGFLGGSHILPSHGDTLINTGADLLVHSHNELAEFILKS